MVQITAPSVLEQGCMHALTYVHKNLWQSGTCMSPAQQSCEQKLRDSAAHVVQHPYKERGQWKKILQGRYEVDMSQHGILGEGGFCLCRKGRCARTGQSVAVKLYKSNESSFSPVNQQTCLMKHRRSVTVLKTLLEPFMQPDDPKLWTTQLESVKPDELFMRLLDYSQDANGEPEYDPVDGELYLVTELAQQSLKDFVGKRREASAPPSKETVRSITKAIILVMAGLHAKGYVHMDVKPENLMLFDGCLKLIDVDGCMAIGTRISPTDASISFSPCYCAPEWAGFVLDAATQATDILAAPGLDAWSVGCTICELVTLDPILRSTYNRFSRANRRNGKLYYMDFLKKLEQSPVPDSVNQFDSELMQLVSRCLLVCTTSERMSCAESLDVPYLASDRLQRTKSSPLKAQAYEDDQVE